MPGFEAGTAYLTLTTSARGFHREISAEVSKIKDVSVPVSADTSRLREVVPQFARIGGEAGKAFKENAERQKVQLDADISALERKTSDAKRSLDDLRKEKAEAKVDADTTLLTAKLQQVEARLADLRSREVTPKVSADIAVADARLTQLRTKLDDLSRNPPTVRPDADTKAAEAKVADFQSQLDRLRSQRAEVTVDADTGRAQTGIAGIRASLASLGDRHTIDIDVDDHGSASRAGDALGSLFGIGAKFGALIPIFAALGVAIAALSPLAVIAGAGLGAAILGFMGVGKAIGAMSDAETNAATDAQDSAKKQVSASNAIASAKDRLKTAGQNVANSERQGARSIEQALQGQQRAEQNLRNAQREAQRAQETLTEARKSARREIQSLADQVAGGAIAERRAMLDVREAKANLDKTIADPTATQQQREEAQLTYDESVQQLTSLQHQNTNLAADKADADKRGVEGSKQVVSAQDQVAQSNQRVQQAQLEVRNAAQQVADARIEAEQRVQQAQQQVIEAQRQLQQATVQAADTGSTSMKNLQKAMADLSPPAAEFARFLYGLKPQFDALRAAAAAGLFPGITAGLQALSPVFGQITTVVGQLAGAMGGFVREILTQLASPYWVSFFQTIGSVAAPLMQQFAVTLMNVGRAFGDLVLALLPFVPAGLQIVNVLAQIISTLAPFIGQIVGALAGPLAQALAALNPGFAALGQILVAVAGPLGALITQLGLVLTPIVQALVPVFQALGPPITTIINALGGALVTVIGILAPVIANLANTIAPLIQQLANALAPVLGAVANMIGTILTAAINAIMPILPPLIQAVIDILHAFEPIIPVLGQLEASFIQALAPILPVIANLILKLIEAVLPLIPPLIQIIQSILPIFTALLKFLIPIIGWLADLLGNVLAWAITHILQPVLEGIAWLFSHLGDVWHGLGVGIQWVWENLLKPSFELMGRFVHGIGDVVEKTVQWIRDKWADIQEAARKPVKWVVDVVYNHGIVPLWNGLAGLFGLDNLKLHELNLAGGGVLGGYSPGKDTVPAMLSPGEAVLVPELVRAIGPSTILDANKRYSGRKPGSTGGYAGGGIVPGFAGGGIFDSIGSIAGKVADFVGGVASSVGGFIADTAGFIKDVFTMGPTAAVQKLFSTVMGDANKTPGGGSWVQGLIRLPGNVINWLIDKVKSFFGIGDQPAVPGQAGGGIIPGYSPGRDTVPAMLSAGEAVLVPELVRAWGPSNILAANAAARQGFAGGGIVGFADGGIVATPAAAPVAGQIIAVQAPDMTAATASATALNDALALLNGTITILNATVALFNLTLGAFTLGINLVIPALALFSTTIVVGLLPALQFLTDAINIGVLPALTFLAGLLTTGVVPAVNFVATAILVGLVPAMTALAGVTNQALAASLATMQGALNNLTNTINQFAVPALQGLDYHLRTVLTGGNAAFAVSTGQLRDDVVARWTEIDNAVRNAHTSMNTSQNTLAGNIRTAWNNIQTDVWNSVNRQNEAFNALNDGLGRVRLATEQTATWVRDRWLDTQRFVADPVRWSIQWPLNAGIVNAWNVLDGQFQLGKHVDPIPIPFATGGSVNGPGGPTSDKIPAMLSAGEFVVRASIAKYARPFLEALNEGNAEAITATGGPRARLRMAAGGPVEQGLEFARSMAGKPYIWGGADMSRGTDCSGLVGAVTRVLRGQTPGRIGSTANMPWPGFQPGLAGAWSIGFNDHHTAGTLVGTNVESRDFGIPILIGPQASGSDHRQFTHTMWLPEIGGVFVSGGPGGAGGFFDPAPAVNAAFADTYRMIDDVLRFFHGDHAGRLQGVARKAADGVKGAAMTKLSALYASGPGGPATPPIGPVVDQVRAAARRYGWDQGPQWDALVRLIQKESSWNPNIRNKTSSAAGLFQKMESLYGPVEATPAGQADWGLNYIARGSRNFHDPISALAFHNAHNWYDNGGTARNPGWLFKGTNQPERVLSPAQTRSFDTLVRLLGHNGVQIPGSDGATQPVINQHIYPRETQDERAVAAESSRRMAFTLRTA